MSELKPGATVGEYKGNAIITLPVAGSLKFPFTFGVNKAKAILEFLDEIKKFVQENDKKPAEDGEKKSVQEG